MVFRARHRAKWFRLVYELDFNACEIAANFLAKNAAPLIIVFI